ncbi:MAG: hypothetical protein LAQ69_41890 [Acidobacteriia bacterium]|nr:hypothetical protein [Terriglobia bacterium]
MEPLLVFGSTAIGTVVGVVCAVLMMQRRGRLPATEAEKPPQSLASVVAMPSVTIEDLRKVLAERDQTLQQSRDDLEKKQQQLDAVMSEAESAAALRATAEQRGSELATQASAFSEQLKDLAAKAREESLAAEEASRQVAALETQLGLEKRQNQELADQLAHLTTDQTQSRLSSAGQLDTLETQLGLEKRQNQELAEQIARLTTELTDSRLSIAGHLDALEAQLGVEKRQSEELTEQIRCLTIDLSQSRQTHAEALEYRASLEAELGVGRERITQLTEQVAGLTRERADFEVRLREERQSAARGLELLTLVQNTLAGAANKGREDAPNGNGAALRVPAAVNGKTEDREVAASHLESSPVNLAIPPLALEISPIQEAAEVLVPDSIVESAVPVIA